MISSESDGRTYQTHIKTNLKEHALKLPNLAAKHLQAQLQRKIVQLFGQLERRQQESPVEQDRSEFHNKNHNLPCQQHRSLKVRDSFSENFGASCPPHPAGPFSG